MRKEVKGVRNRVMVKEKGKEWVLINRYGEGEIENRN